MYYYTVGEAVIEKPMPWQKQVINCAWMFIKWSEDAPEKCEEWPLLAAKLIYNLSNITADSSGIKKRVHQRKGTKDGK